jgi:hypothetical protein
VSRNLFGATAFPLRETDDSNDPNQFSYLFALNCQRLKGFDTEARQRQCSGRIWRPGEKAFGSIPQRRVIAHVKIKRLGGSSTGGFSFRIDPAEKWAVTSHHGGADSAQIKYIESELDAWKGPRRDIEGRYDFANA